ncbi:MULTISPECIES: LysR family transcriptional regulator [Shewanella]|uniref:LysR family transcriptional regulator n=1 Tax=Shewanella TaxID=22 RepID=UPI000D14EE58|nr:MULTISPECIES: LysR family transcriptional regulator [Shewanella]AYV12240.1 LysR family transcriptional regulator [Shewanella algae]MBO2585156.1 LysR family transcriptional regulator [Shewanella algae]MBO2618811.1 LysR family transcriptional regulator [Shewanella algae]MBO2652341.1 LysR family transcriptional regulator [Shewanella algae]MBO2660936.1 LysR family transcriptional regulator [Shewanella algae]
MKDIKRLDYELMQVLIAIDEHRNCQNAAHALRISNSAISRHLKQLREIFDDTLYIRRASGFIPTHKASQLLPMVQDLCQRYQELENQFTEYQPAKSREHFVISVYDDFSPIIHKILNNKVRPFAPDMSFDIRILSHEYTTELENGNIDIAVMSESYTGAHLQGNLFAEVRNLYLLGNRKHPFLQDNVQVTLEDLFKYPYYEMDNFCDLPEPLIVSAARRRNQECVIAGSTGSLASLASVLLDMPYYSISCNLFTTDYVAGFPNLIYRKLPLEISQTLLSEINTNRDIGHYVVVSDLNKSQARDWLKEVLVRELKSEWNLRKPNS